MLLWIGCAFFAVVCGLSLLLARTAERNMKLSLHQSLYRHSAYVRYMRDKHDLNGLGIAQQLTRNRSGLSSFGVTFSSLPLIGGALFLLGPAVAAGGPAVIGFGWPLLSLFGMLTACSIAAFASAIPTAGGCYHWALAVGSRRSGLWSGWLHLLGTAIMLLITNVWLADWMSRNIERHWGYTGGTGLYGIILLMLFVTQATANTKAIRALGKLFTCTAGLQLILFIALCAVLAVSAWPGHYPFQMLSLTAKDWNPLQAAGGHEPSMVLGLLLLQRMFLGVGDGAQAGEETNDPRINLPWSIYFAAIALSIFGFILFASILVHAVIGIDGLTSLTAMGDWLLNVWTASGAVGSILFFSLVVVLVWANGSATMGAASRTLFAMARDESIPFGNKLAEVSFQYRSPVLSVLVVAIGTGGLSLLGVLVVPYSSLQPILQQLILLSLAALHSAYAIPIIGRLRNSLRGTTGRAASPIGRSRLQLTGPWSLGKYSGAVDGVAFVWLTVSGLAAVWLLGLPALMAAVVCLLAITMMIEYKQRGLRRKSPVKIVGSMRFSRRSMEECIRMERKFPQQF